MTRSGCFLPSFAASRPIDPLLVGKMARRAEALNYAHVFVGDHLVWNVGMIDPIAMLSYLSAITERIRLGTGVYLLPLRHPTIVAKQVASLDVLSDGRLILGVGVGGENPREYEAAGVELRARGARIEEALTALRKLLNQDPEPFDGQFVSLPSFVMEPPPIQDPLPVWIGGRADAVVERAARVAEGWFPVWVSAERYTAARRKISDIRRQANGFDYALNIFTHISESTERSREVLGEHMRSAYRLPFEKFERYAAIGTATDIQEKLHRYVEAGVTDVAFNLSGPDPLSQLEQLGEEVLPWLAEQ